MVKKSKFPWWWRLSLILGVICIVAFVFVHFGYWERLTRPKAIKMVQAFKKGESFNYKISEISKSDIDGFTSTTQRATNLSLKVPSVSADGVIDIVITKESGVFTMMDKTYQDSDVGKQVRIKLLPTGHIKSVEGDTAQLNWMELVFRFLPRQEIKVGDSWELQFPKLTSEQLSNLSPELLSKASPEALQMLQTGKIPGSDMETKFTVVGFERIKGFDCVKVREVSRDVMNLQKLGVETKDVTGSIYTESEKELFLAYRKGYLVVKSHTIETMESEVKGKKLITTTETTVELF